MQAIETATDSEHPDQSPQDSISELQNLLSQVHEEIVALKKIIRLEGCPIRMRFKVWLGLRAIETIVVRKKEMV